MQLQRVGHDWSDLAHIVINIFSVDCFSFQVNNYITWVYSCSAYNIDRHLVSMQWALDIIIIIIYIGYYND